MSVVLEYFDALERLKKNKPIVVEKGTKITKDAVALEAGRKKGTIKKSRSVFKALILAIDDAAEKNSEPKQSLDLKVHKFKTEAEHYRRLYEDTLGDNIQLVKRIRDLEMELLGCKGYRS
ncbi:hypothetical protein ACU5B6_20165 [Moritella viscosa]|uniref:hypothetical protein n=1 Tax=Moritella viscosa TaxID=80854 RepID=UPI000918504F|nr:hypothetical protein [Moritella viscosa]SHO08899.1 Putative uncharacterized protein [Moritella viscosa]